MRSSPDTIIPTGGTYGRGRTGPTLVLYDVHERLYPDGRHREGVQLLMAIAGSKSKSEIEAGQNLSRTERGQLRIVDARRLIVDDEQRPVRKDAFHIPARSALVLIRAGGLVP